MKLMHSEFNHIKKIHICSFSIIIRMEQTEICFINIFKKALNLNDLPQLFFF